MFSSPLIRVTSAASSVPASSSELPAPDLSREAASGPGPGATSRMEWL